MSSVLKNMQFKRRIALWVLGQALPEASDLAPYTRAATRSVALAAMGGVLLAVAFAGAMVGFYFYLTASGLATGVALGVVVSIALLAGLLMLSMSSRAAKKTATVTESLSLFQNPRGDALTDMVNAAMNGFLEGVLNETKTPKESHDIEDSLEDLEDELEHIEDELAKARVKRAAKNQMDML